MTLVDTSAWIISFRKNDPLDLEAVVDFDEVVTVLPVVQEVLQGFKHEGAFRAAKEAMLALPRVDDPLDQELFLSAADLYRRARKAGATVRSSVDCLIAASALRHDLVVLHRDRDYAELARLTGLKQRRV